MGHYKHLCEYTTEQLIVELSNRREIEKIEVSDGKEFEIKVEENSEGEEFWMKDEGYSSILVIKISQ